MSKHLVDPTAPTPKKRQPHASLLTSADSLKEMEGKEHKKGGNGGEREAKKRKKRKEETKRGGGQACLGKAKKKKKKKAGEKAKKAEERAKTAEAAKHPPKRSLLGIIYRNPFKEGSS